MSHKPPAKLPPKLLQSRADAQNLTARQELHSPLSFWQKNTILLPNSQVGVAPVTSGDIFVRKPWHSLQNAVLIHA